MSAYIAEMDPQITMQAQRSDEQLEDHAIVRTNKNSNCRSTILSSHWTCQKQAETKTIPLLVLAPPNCLTKESSSNYRHSSTVSILQNFIDDEKINRQWA